MFYYSPSKVKIMNFQKHKDFANTNTPQPFEIPDIPLPTFLCQNSRMMISE